MILIVGPAFSGKSAYARKLLPRLTGEQDKDVPHTGIDGDIEESVDAPGYERDCLLTEVQELAGRGMDETDIKALADSLCARAEVLTASETGAGIVPMDEDMRRLRENQGKLLSELADRAGCVVRVFYGIPEVIKGKAPEFRWRYDDASQ